MTFELFDRVEGACVREGNLPHWYQPGVTYFVTFRTEDSVPQDLSQKWYTECEAWLRREGIDPASSSWRQSLQSRPDLERAFHATFTRRYMEYLDRGLGACVLRLPHVAKFVADSLTHFDGQRDLMGDFVVMPNHVHLLVCLLGSTEIESQCRSWKKFAAGQINRAWEKAEGFGRKRALTIWCGVRSSLTHCGST